MHEIDTIANDMVDTLQYDASAVSDSLHEAAKMITITVPQSPIQPVDTSLVHLNVADWPITLWGDTIIKPTSLYDELHAFGQPLAYSVMRDDWVMGLLMVAFLLLVIIVAWGFKYLKPQARNFFIPSNTSSTSAPPVKTTAEIYPPIFLTVLSGIYCGLIAYAYVTTQFDLQAGLIPPYVVVGVCIGVFLVYYLLRWILYEFINWIFFSHSKRLTWNNGYSFLSTIECLLIFPVFLFAINSRWGFETTLIIVVSVLGVVRLALLWHSFRTFFPKIYGLLHLFAYLCTLEMIPLLLLWKTLTALSSFLMVK